MRWAIVEDGIVVNVVVGDEPLADNWVPGEIADIGDFYSEGTFVKPVIVAEPEDEVPGL